MHNKCKKMNGTAQAKNAPANNFRTNYRMATKYDISTTKYDMIDHKI